jgi:hypothetical protein
MSKPYRIATLVKSIWVEPSSKIQFRIDIFSWSDVEYFCQIWRLDLYRIKPTAYDEHADEHFMVLDHGINWWDLRARTADELIDMVLDEIHRQLTVPDESEP